MRMNFDAESFRKPLTVALVAAMIGTGAPVQAATLLSGDVPPASQDNAKPKPKVVAKGALGDCTWTLYSNGELTISKGRMGEKKKGSNVFPWAKYASDIKTVTFKDGVILPKDCSYMFSGCENLVAVKASGVDAKRVTTTRGMFSECKKLTSFDAADWDTKSLEDMRTMFYNCESLKELDLAKWNTAKVKSLDSTFCGAASLENLDLSAWDTSKLESLNSAFYGCSSLEELNLSGWKTPKLKNLFGVFAHCSSLKSVDASAWNTSKVKSMTQAFDGCKALESVYLTGWDTSFANSLYYTFRDCESLKEIAVGTKFEVDRVFPEATATNGMWWSTEDGGWFTNDQIQADRKGVKDIYRAKADFTRAFLAPIADQVYNGSAIEPDVSASLVPYTSSVLAASASSDLVRGVDFDVTFERNVNAGKGIVYVTGKGLYEGVIKAFFNILPKDVTVKADDFTKVEGEADPTFTATVNGTIGEDEIAYELSREKGDKPGTYAITPTGDELQGNYKVTFQSGTLTITKKDTPVDPDGDEKDIVPDNEEKENKDNGKKFEPATKPGSNDTPRNTAAPAAKGAADAKKARLPKTDDPFSFALLRGVVALGLASIVAGDALRIRWRRNK